jgi:SAM-dependent methyltransferase
MAFLKAKKMGLSFLFPVYNQAMNYKDHFSRQSEHYARYRPEYPADLFLYLSSVSPRKCLAWDCATGSGQSAVGLSRYFEKVIATDASRQQIDHAREAENIEYRLAKAENSRLEISSVDLITVAQALHWFDLDAFFREADRVLKPGGILAVWTYALMKVSPEVDAVIKRFHSQVVGAYWPPERAMVDNRYEGIKFPFKPLQPPELKMSTSWDLEHFRGYLNSWSATQRFHTLNNSDPLDLIRDDLNKAWGKVSYKREITWPLTLKVRGKPGGP